MNKEFGIALKALIKNKEGKYLILHKSDKDDINPNQIDIPGGRMEFGEDFITALRREAKEELNIEIEIGNCSRVWSLIKDNLHLIGITFNAQYIGGEIKLSFEHDSYSWVNKEEIINGDYPLWIKEEFKTSSIADTFLF